MSSSRIEAKPRIVIAPLGEQPAAVVAPLLGPPLRPLPDDHLVLIVGNRSAHLVGCVRDALGAKGLRVHRVFDGPSTSIEASVLADIRQAAENREPWLLLNGGPWQWLHALMNLWPADAIRVAVSRDHVLRIHGSANEVLESHVADVGTDGDPTALLALLGLAWNERDQTLKGRDSQLDHVTHVVEKSGQLFAVIDAALWNVHVYRRFVLDWQRLQALGLDKRRILLTGLPRAPRQRAKEDMVPYETARYPASRWLEDVRAGDAISRAERQRDRPSRPQDALSRPEGSWNGPPLLVTMGPQPGTTLTAAWLHRPRDLHLAYDSAQPDVMSLVGRLAALPELKAQNVYVHPFDRRRGLADRGIPDDVHVNLTPGDKTSTYQLHRFAVAREKIAVWFLDGERLRCANRDIRPPADTGHVPIQAWVGLHAPGDAAAVTMSPWLRASPGTAEQDQRKSLGHLSRQTVAWCVNNPPHGLAKLWTRKRNAAFHLDLTREPVGLRLPDGTLLDLSTLPTPVALGMLPAPGQNGQRRPNGVWFEWIVAWHLAEVCRVDELATNVRVERGPNDPVRPGLRDEMDILVRQGCRYSYWSCKAYVQTRSGPTRDEIDVADVLGHLEEARAQADRFLGRRQPVFLVVPNMMCLPRALEGRIETRRLENSGCGRVLVKDLGSIVDCRFLSRWNDVRNAAAGL